MTDKPIIEVENLSKTYRIRHEAGSYLTLRDILSGIIIHPIKWLKKKFRKESKEIFWALKDVNFTINRGEVVGIIGANGAGKSTLLKILSKITPPSHGKVTIRGNMASLLEVGTGFHPELTGRENILLNGAILGMTKKEIVKKFDEIISFAGISKFLDTPVKHYSSGMYVRLAFSVAAHMEPDILVIDEVLAVGDAEFQKKCLGKMEDITKQDGRTILFVSHNTAAIKQLCDKCILLQNGQIKFIGKTDEAVALYLSVGKTSDGFNINNRRFSPKEIMISDGKILKNKIADNQFNYGDELDIELQVKSLIPVRNCSIELVIKDKDGYPIIFLPSGLRFKTEFDFDVGTYLVLCKIPSLPLAEGIYYIDVILAEAGKKFYDYIENALTFKIIFCDPNITGHSYTQNSKQGSVYISAEFHQVKQ